MKLSKLEIDIRKFLPHRSPMLMVRDLLYLDHKNTVTDFKVLENNIFVKKTSFSEEGLIENAAQTCSAIIGQDFFGLDDYDGTGTKVVGYISAIKKFEILTLPEISDTIITKAYLMSSFDTDAFSICTVKSETFLNEKRIAQGEMNFIIQEM